MGQVGSKAWLEGAIRMLGMVSPSQEFQVTAADGTRIFAQWDRPVGKPRGVVLIVHGFGEHLRRHARWAECFVGQSIAVLRFDLRGHGLSQGRRGDLPSYTALLDDLDLMLSVAQQEFPDRKVLMLGHSFGGGLVANWTLDRQHPLVPGVLLTAPWFRLHHEPGPFKRVLARLGKRIWPTLSIPTSIRDEQLTSDPEVRSRYLDDPLVFRQISLRMAVLAIDAGRRALHRAAECSLPALLMHGTADHVTSPQGSCLFSNRSATAAVTLFEGLKHEIHQETRWDEVREAALTWLDQQQFFPSL